MDEMEFTETESNMNDLICEYQGGYDSCCEVEEELEWIRTWLINYLILVIKYYIYYFKSNELKVLQIILLSHWD